MKVRVDDILIIGNNDNEHWNNLENVIEETFSSRFNS